MIWDIRGKKVGIWEVVGKKSWEIMDMGDWKLRYGILGVKKCGIWEIENKKSWDMGD